jgi:hypothetical protein
MVFPNSFFIKYFINPINILLTLYSFSVLSFMLSHSIIYSSIITSLNITNISLKAIIAAIINLVPHYYYLLYAHSNLNKNYLYLNLCF